MAEKPPPSDPTSWLQAKLGEFHSSVRFGRGVVGMTTRAMLGLLVIWGAVVWKMGPSLVQNAWALGGGVIATVTFLLWNRSVHRFAERNPAQAMLDGGEFVEYEKHRSEVKGLPPQQSPTLIEDSPAKNLIERRDG